MDEVGVSGRLGTDPSEVPNGRVLLSDPRSVAEARRFARESLGSVVPVLSEGCRADVELVVSELVTNAVRYGTEPGDSMLLVLEVGEAGVRVEVHDPVRRVPKVRVGSGARQRGCGLVIVAALARWGVEHRPLGKVVWAEVAR